MPHAPAPPPGASPTAPGPVTLLVAGDRPISGHCCHRKFTDWWVWARELEAASVTHHRVCSVGGCSAQQVVEGCARRGQLAFRALAQAPVAVWGCGLLGTQLTHSRSPVFSGVPWFLFVGELSRWLACAEGPLSSLSRLLCSPVRRQAAAECVRRRVWAPKTPGSPHCCRAPRGVGHPWRLRAALCSRGCAAETRREEASSDRLRPEETKSGLNCSAVVFVSRYCCKMVTNIAA